MPIYEYVCVQCAKKFRKLVGMIANPTPLQCPKCQSDDLKRQISRFARVRSEDETLDSLADEMEAAGDSDDPKTLRKLMKQMGGALDEDMDEEFDQMMESPESPESLEADG